MHAIWFQRQLGTRRKFFGTIHLLPGSHYMPNLKVGMDRPNNWSGYCIKLLQIYNSNPILLRGSLWEFFFHGNSSHFQFPRGLSRSFPFPSQIWSLIPIPIGSSIWIASLDMMLWFLWYARGQKDTQTGASQCSSGTLITWNPLNKHFAGFGRLQKWLYLSWSTNAH